MISLTECLTNWMTELIKITELFRDVIKHWYQYFRSVLQYILINLSILTVEMLSDIIINNIDVWKITLIQIARLY